MTSAIARISKTKNRMKRQIPARKIRFVNVGFTTDRSEECGSIEGYSITKSSEWGFYTMLLHALRTDFPKKDPCGKTYLREDDGKR